MLVQLAMLEVITFLLTGCGQGFDELSFSAARRVFT